MKKSIVALLRALPLQSSFSPDALLHIHIFYYFFYVFWNKHRLQLLDSQL